MARRYTRQEKIDALVCVAYKRGKLARVAADRNIPLRTLENWWRVQKRRTPPPPDENAEAEAFTEMVTSLISHVSTLIAQIDTLSPALRVNALRQMTTTLERLKKLRPQVTGDHVGHIVFVNPEGHETPKPMWAYGSQEEYDADRLDI